MSAPEGRRIIVAKWVERAEEDHLTTTHLLELDEDCPFNAIAFHAQQTVEKYIKAVLVSRSGIFRGYTTSANWLPCFLKASRFQSSRGSRNH